MIKRLQKKKERLHTVKKPGNRTWVSLLKAQASSFYLHPEAQVKEPFPPGFVLGKELTENLTNVPDFKKSNILQEKIYFIKFNCLILD